MAEIDENEFFRQATARISSSLDIGMAMQRCFQYLDQFLPIDGMLLAFYEPGLGPFASPIS